MTRNEFEKKFKKDIKGVVLDLDGANNKNNYEVLMDIAYAYYSMGEEDRGDEIHEALTGLI